MIAMRPKVASAGTAAAARLPAVHPLAAIGVLAGNEDGRVGLDEVFLLREEIVVRREHRAAELFRREVDELSEIHYGVLTGTPAGVVGCFAL